MASSWMRRSRGCVSTIAYTAEQACKICPGRELTCDASDRPRYGALRMAGPLACTRQSAYAGWWTLLFIGGMRGNEGE
jgi:hypothetical protein